MWKQSSGDWRGGQLSKRVERAVWDDRREAYTCSSSDQGGFMRPTDGLVTLYPHRGGEKNPNQNKCLCSSTEAFDQQHIFGFRARLLGTPVRTWNRICINKVREECVNNATKESCSRNIGLPWLMSGLCGLGVWVWWSDWMRRREMFLISITQTGKHVFLFTNMR